jgi:hypothetical protein
MRIVRDQQHRALEIRQRLDQRLTRIDVEMIGRFVQHQQMRCLARRQRQQQPCLFATGQIGHRRFRAVGIQSEARELGTRLRFGGTRQGALHVAERAFLRRQFLFLVLREIADTQLRAAPHLACQRVEPAGQQPRQGRFAIAVGAQQRDPVVGVDGQRQVAQHWNAVITNRDAFQHQDGRGDPGRFRKGETRRGRLDDGLDLRQPRQRLDARLRLPRLAGLVTEAVDERLDVGALRRHPFGRTRLLQCTFGPDADEFIEATRRQLQLAAVEMGDRLHRAVQQAAVVGDDDGRAGEACQPAFQPQRRLKVEMIGWLVQQQQVGVGEQRRGECHAHPPAARETVDRPLLGRLVEAEPGQDGGRSCRCRIGADHAQPFMQLRQPLGRGGRGFREQCQPLLVGFQHRVEQAGGAVRRFLPDGGDAGAGGQPDFSAVQLLLAQDGAQQRGLASAVATDQPDAAPGVDRQIGAIQQQSAGDADADAGKREEGHGGG